MDIEEKNTTPALSTSSAYWFFEYELMVTILIPSLLLLIIVLVAILIACFLHRKRTNMKIMKKGSKILTPRTPVIFTGELGRYNDSGLLQNRLFSDEEKKDHAPEYEERRGRKQDDQGNKIHSRQDERLLPRLVPPYRDRHCVA